MGGLEWWKVRDGGLGGKSVQFGKVGGGGGAPWGGGNGMRRTREEGWDVE